MHYEANLTFLLERQRKGCEHAHTVFQQNSRQLISAEYATILKLSPPLTLSLPVSLKYSLILPATT